MPARKPARPSRTPELSGLVESLRRAADTIEGGLPLQQARSLAHAARHLETQLTAFLAAAETLVPPGTSAPAPPWSPDDFGMKIDREANAALAAWGRHTLDEFLAMWRQLDPALLKRTCTVLGLAAAKRWTRPQKAELHRRARRFSRNTAV